MVHVYRANDQRATRYRVDLGAKGGIWIKNPANRLLMCFKCGRCRPAKNLVAHVYYDGTWFYCTVGKGCRA